MTELEKTSGVAGCACVVGQVTDHQRRHRDVASAVHPVRRALLVAAPLREPLRRVEIGPSPTCSCFTHLRITQEARSRLRSVRIDIGSSHRGSGHGAMHNEIRTRHRGGRGFQFANLLLDPPVIRRCVSIFGLPVAGQEPSGRAVVGVVRVCTGPFPDRVWGIGFVESTRPSIRSPCRAG